MRVEREVNSNADREAGRIAAGDGEADNNDNNNNNNNNNNNININNKRGGGDEIDIEVAGAGGGGREEDADAENAAQAEQQDAGERDNFMDGPADRDGGDDEQRRRDEEAVAEIEARLADKDAVEVAAAARKDEEDPDYPGDNPKAVSSVVFMVGGKKYFEQDFPTRFLKHTNTHSLFPSIIERPSAWRQALVQEKRLQRAQELLTPAWSRSPRHTNWRVQNREIRHCKRAENVGDFLLCQRGLEHVAEIGKCENWKFVNACVCVCVPDCAFSFLCVELLFLLGKHILRVCNTCVECGIWSVC